MLNSVQVERDAFEDEGALAGDAPTPVTPPGKNESVSWDALRLRSRIAYVTNVRSSLYMRDHEKAAHLSFCIINASQR